MPGNDSICCFRGSSFSGGRRACWEITTACNLACWFCHRYRGEVEVFDTTRLTEAIGLLDDHGIRDVILTGGEPFLHPDLREIITALTTRGIDVDICSNGTVIEEDDAAFLKGHASGISLSLDSHMSDFHDTLRGRKGTWHKTVHTIRLLVGWGISVHTLTLLLADTIGQIESTASFIADLGVTSISFIGHIPVGAGENPLLSDSRQQELAGIFRRLRSRYSDVEINTKQVFRSTGNEKCRAGTAVLGIDANLHVSSCLLLRMLMEAPALERMNGLLGCCPGSAHLVQEGRVH